MSSHQIVSAEISREQLPTEITQKQAITPSDKILQPVKQSPTPSQNIEDDISVQMSLRRNEILKVSTSVVSDKHIDVVANLVCYIVSTHLEEEHTRTLIKDFRTSSQPSPPYDPMLTTREKLLTKIVKFFRFVRDLVGLTTAELAHALNLICAFIHVESDSSSDERRSVINENTLGTLFLCGIIISLKMNRDHPYKNSFWAKKLNINPAVLNASELTFLEKIEFSIYLDEKDYYELYTSIIDIRT